MDKDNSGGSFTIEETMALIRTCRRLTNGIMASNMDWKEVASYLRQEGVYKNSAQLRKKWGNLMCRYRSYRERGRINNKYTYFSEMDKLFGDQEIEDTYTRGTKQGGGQLEDLFGNHGHEVQKTKNNKKIQDKNIDERQNNGIMEEPILLSVGETFNDTVSIQSSNQDTTKTRNKLTNKEEYYKAKKLFVENENKRRDADAISKIMYRKEKIQILGKVVKALLAQNNGNCNPY